MAQQHHRSLVWTTRRRIVWIVIALAILVAIWIDRSWIRADGVVVGELTAISPIVEARLQKIYVRCLEYVKRDQLIVEFENEQTAEAARQQLRQLELLLSQAQAAAQIAAMQAQTAHKLYEAQVTVRDKLVVIFDAQDTLVGKQYVAKLVWEKAKADVAVAGAQVLATEFTYKTKLAEKEKAETDARILQKRIAEYVDSPELTGRFTLKAPKDGIVTQCAARVGEVIPAKTPIFQIYNPDDAYVVAFFSPKYIERLIHGQLFTVQVGGIQRSLRGRIAAFYPELSALPSSLTRYFWQQERWSQYAPVRITLEGLSATDKTYLRAWAQVTVSTWTLFSGNGSSVFRSANLLPVTGSGTGLPEERLNVVSISPRYPISPQPEKDLEGTPDARRLLILRQIRKAGGSITPLLNPYSDTGYEYKDIADNCAADLPFLTDHGYLKRQFVDRVNLCAKCASHHLSLREVCPTCRSPDLSSEVVLHHFRCGYAGKQSEFTQGDGRRLCPKCGVQLKHLGTDHDRLENMFLCMACRVSFEDPPVDSLCRSCATTVPASELPSVDVFRYVLTSLGTTACREGKLFKSEKTSLFVGETPVYRQIIFRELLQNEAKRASVTKNGFCIIFIDIQNPSQSEYSPVLAETTAGPLRTCLREIDLLGQLSDSTLAILLPNTGIQQADELRQRIVPVLVKCPSCTLSAVDIGCPEDLRKVLAARGV